MLSVDPHNGEFSILPIRMPSTRSYLDEAIHEIRIRRNAPNTPTADDVRSLFLKNVPADSTAQHFRAIFAELVGPGRFEAITFEKNAEASQTVDPAQATKLAGLAKKRKRNNVEFEEEEREIAAARLPETWTRYLQRSGSSAVALLADEKSVQLVLKAIAKAHKTKRYPVWGTKVGDDVSPLGSPWISSHLQLSRGDKETTQNAVHAFFNAFNRKEKAAAELAKRLRNEPDEDGFVTVTRGGRVTPASRNEAELAKQRMVDRQSKKTSEMTDFYRFQLRQRRKTEQAALVQRFEEDRKKVNAMRQRRGNVKPES